MADTYITLDELRNEPYNLVEDVVDSVYADVLMQMTKEMVDKLCSQDFTRYPTEGTVPDEIEFRFDGNGKDTIFLHRTLESLDRVRIYSDNTNYVEYDGDNFQVKPTYISWNSFDNTSVRGFRQGVFDKGLGNIGVIGVYGYTTIPAPIVYLQGRLIQKIVESDDFAEKFDNQKIGDFSGKLLLNSLGDDPLGDKQLDTIIKQYRRPISYAVT